MKKNYEDWFKRNNIAVWIATVSVIVSVFTFLTKNCFVPDCASSCIEKEEVHLLSGRYYCKPGAVSSLFALDLDVKSMTYKLRLVNGDAIEGKISIQYEKNQSTCLFVTLGLATSEFETFSESYQAIKPAFNVLLRVQRKKDCSFILTAEPSIQFYQ